MKMLCTILMFFGFSCGAQGQAVWQQVFTNRTTVGSSANIRNAGQTQHIFYGSVTGGTCGANRSVYGVEASYDNTTFFPISKGLGTLFGTGTFQVSGAGSYPFVRMRIYILASSNCIVNGYYSGTTSSLPETTVVPGGNYQVVQYHAIGATTGNVTLITNPATIFDTYGVNIKVTENASTVTVVFHDGPNSPLCTPPVGNSDTVLSAVVPVGGGDIVLPVVDNVYYHRNLLASGGNPICLSLTSAGTFRISAYFTYRYGVQ